jgi:hypothetical protein
MKLARQFFRFWIALARELSDENAYARYLDRTGKPHSAAAWQCFIDRRHRRKYHNAKCC